MRFQQSLDALPIVGVFIAFAVTALLITEAGYRLGRWWQERTPEEKEGPTGMIVGSLLALMAFLLAITMGMAVDGECPAVGAGSDSPQGPLEPLTS